MGKKMSRRVPVAKRRGVRADPGASWTMTLVHCDGDVGGVLNTMSRKKFAGEVAADVTRDLLRGKLPAPAAPWALLVKLKGQPWLYFLRPRRDPDAAQVLAARTGLLTMSVGEERVSGSRFMQVYEGRRAVQGLVATGLDLEDPKGRAELLAAVAKSRNHPRAWWEKFRDEREVIDALVRERDAYVPWIGAAAKNGAVSVSGWDDDGLLEPSDYERIDLLALGAGAKLAARNPADQELADAIEEGDPGRVRKAVANGADLSGRLPGSNTTALDMAVGGYVGWKSGRRDAWLDILRTLLEAGAPARGTGGDIPPIGQFACRTDLGDEQMNEGLALLLDHGADACARTTSGIPVTHFVAEKGRLAALKLLHARGVNLACKGADGKSAGQYVERLLKLKNLAWMNARVAKKVVEFLKSVEHCR